jgi:hypothetical protein
MMKERQEGRPGWYRKWTSGAVKLLSTAAQSEPAVVPVASQRSFPLTFLAARGTERDGYGPRPVDFHSCTTSEREGNRLKGNMAARSGPLALI